MKAQHSLPGISNSCRKNSGLNSLIQGEHSFIFPGSFWLSFIFKARESAMVPKTLAVISSSLEPPFPKWLSNSFPNFWGTNILTTQGWTQTKYVFRPSISLDGHIMPCLSKRLKLINFQLHPLADRFYHHQMYYSKPLGMARKYRFYTAFKIKRIEKYKACSDK